MNHIMIDGYKGDENRLNDLKTVNSILNDIVSSLNLEAVMPPFLLPYYYSKDAEDDGISAFIFLLGGHITIHTFPRRGCVFVDLLYDGYFSEEKLERILKENFIYSEQRVSHIERRFLDPTIDKDKLYDGTGGNLDFGPHIIARIENVESFSLEKMYDILEEMPGYVNMNPICRPYVLKSSKTSPAYLSGIILIAQSHIAFHYDLAEKTLFCDMFSCSFYKSEKFVEYLGGIFGDFEHCTMIRGSKHEAQIKNREISLRQLGKWIKNAE